MRPSLAFDSLQQYKVMLSALIQHYHQFIGQEDKLKERKVIAKMVVTTLETLIQHQDFDEAECDMCGWLKLLRHWRCLALCDCPDC